MPGWSWVPTWAVVDRDLRKYFRSPGLLPCDERFGPVSDGPIPMLRL